MNVTPGSVVLSVEIDAGTVQRGDQVMIGGQQFTVRDMHTLASSRKRLEFATGETFTMAPTTILWAARRVPPRLLLRRRRR
ncbi:hypothetical protein [Streptomyces litchfieldiae]|uniref:Uncharacterized protein n=1 Tax=Streptomyces litchfieldiae TaxID=3075543 RepID=A0ABU2ML15_9ACTN|nr:hypothetical protein [Streptomyces sp. DSM 44938]MDT0342073.1 hypothetical protein [Streptomyces sp. DSM 44938]